MLVLLAFAAIAVALSVIGVYGVLACLVGQRRREIGLRLAIGASPSDVVWLFVREGAALTLVGLGAGLAGALAAGRWISALLFGVTPADPATLAIVFCALAGAAARPTSRREGLQASIQVTPSGPSRRVTRHAWVQRVRPSHRRSSAAVRARAAPVVVHTDRRSATVFVLDGRNPTIRSDIWRTAKDLDVTIKRAGVHSTRSAGRSRHELPTSGHHSTALMVDAPGGRTSSSPA